MLKKFKRSLKIGVLNSKNLILINYIENILSLNYKDLLKIYLNIDKSLKTLFAKSLPNGFSLLQDFKNMSGVYYFLAKDGKGYLGSTKNL